MPFFSSKKSFPLEISGRESAGMVFVSLKSAVRKAFWGN
jgi:hypothetical protein